MERDRFSRIVKNGFVALGISGCVSQSAIPYESTKPVPSAAPKSSELPSGSFAPRVPTRGQATESELKAFPVGTQLQIPCMMAIIDSNGKIDNVIGVSVKQLQNDGTWYNNGSCYLNPK